MKTAESIFKTLKELDAIIITSEKNRLYYTGFHSTFGILLFLKNGEIHFYTDSRYIEMAEQYFANNAQIQLHLYGANAANYKTIYEFLSNGAHSNLSNPSSYHRWVI